MLHPADVEKLRKSKVGIIAEKLADIIFTDVQVVGDIVQTELAGCIGTMSRFRTN